MSQPLFVSRSSSLLPNWVEAFPEASLSVGCPRRLDSFDSSVIFLDFTALDREQKHEWLSQILSAERRTVVLSPTPDDQEAIRSIKAGAVGYGHTYSAAQRLREISLVVGHGGLWIGSKIMQRVLAAIHQGSIGNSTNTDPIERFAGVLSAREMAVARYIALGVTNAEISSFLSIKERTVKAHITSIFYKLDVRNRVELALLLNNIQVDQAAIEKPSKRTAL